MADKPSVLFVCVHNAGRSQMAAGWLRHLAEDLIEIRSAGTEPANQINPVAITAMREVGIDMVSNSPFGIAGPKGMEAQIVKLLHDAFKKGLEEPSYAAAMAILDQELFYLSSEDYQRFAMQQIEEARRFVAELGLKQD